MNWKEYKEAMKPFILYNPDDWFYASISGMVSEVGEIVGKLNKQARGDFVPQEDITKEIGDFYWFLALYQHAKVLKTTRQEDLRVKPLLELYGVSDMGCLVSKLIHYVESNFSYSTPYVLDMNISKLTSRKVRGKLQGNGDNR